MVEFYRRETLVLAGNVKECLIFAKLNRYCLFFFWIKFVPFHLQPWISSTLPNRQGPQALSKSDQGTSSGVEAEPLSVETKPSGRKELPAVIAFH
jgi:hypothetical protein